MLSYTKKTVLGIEASSVDFSKLTSINIPESFPYGIPMLNKQGYEKTTTNEYIDDFIKIASHTNTPLLEIGSAFGHITQRVLAVKGRITACDMGEEHLEIMIKNTPKEYLKNLYVYPAKFPDEVEFPNNTFEAIIASRILHFLDVKRLEDGFHKIHEWLIPGGKFFFIAMSVYHESIREHFLSIYKNNVKNALKWCGIIDDQLKFVPQHRAYAPSFLHVFDIPELEKNMPGFGFKIEKISLFTYPDDKSSGSRGHIGFIATKV